MACSPSGVVVVFSVVAFSAFSMVISCYDRFSGEVAVALSATGFLLVSMILSCCGSCASLVVRLTVRSMRMKDQKMGRTKTPR